MCCFMYDDQRIILIRNPKELGGAPCGCLRRVFQAELTVNVEALRGKHI